MPPTPKPPGQRRRRNLKQNHWASLPATGLDGPMPELPPKHPDWSPATRAWWAKLWTSPMARAYLETDIDPLTRLARLKEDFDRGLLGASALPAIQQLEDRFGLSPKARRTLQWEISRAGEQPKEQKPKLADVRRLRAVDPAP